MSADLNRDKTQDERIIFFGREARRLRRSRGLSGAEVAAKLGEFGTDVSDAYLRLVERGGRTARLDLFLALSDLYAVPPERLLRDETPADRIARSPEVAQVIQAVGRGGEAIVLNYLRRMAVAWELHIQESQSLAEEPRSL